MRNFYDLYCPKCHEKATTANPMFRDFSQRLCLPIFLCSSCRMVYIDKPIIRRMVNEWRKSGAYAREIPLKQLYGEFLGGLEEMATGYFMSHLGYKRIRFIKRPAEEKS